MFDPTQLPLAISHEIRVSKKNKRNITIKDSISGRNKRKILSLKQIITLKSVSLLFVAGSSYILTSWD
jgi:hypothetical protein